MICYDQEVFGSWVKCFGAMDVIEISYSNGGPDAKSLLEGSLPTELALLYYLAKIDFSKNKLTGAIPDLGIYIAIFDFFFPKVLIYLFIG
jgi:hypothetical protein